MYTFPVLVSDEFYVCTGSVAALNAQFRGELRSDA